MIGTICPSGRRFLSLSLRGLQHGRADCGAPRRLRPTLLFLSSRDAGCTVVLSPAAATAHAPLPLSSRDAGCTVVLSPAAVAAHVPLPLRA
eukprot:7377261-Prymnesium_polylepis.1